MTTILSISLPEELRAALDAASARERRSRSFVVAEAVRAYLAHQERQAFDDARTRTLREGLALTPAARLRLAEELWRGVCPRAEARQALLGLLRHVWRVRGVANVEAASEAS